MKDMWQQLKTLPRPAKIGLVAFGGAFVLVMIVALIGNNSDLSDQLAAAQEREAALERELSAEKSRVDTLEDELSDAKSAADRATRRAGRAMKIARQEARDELAEREAELDEREGNLNSRAAALTEEEEREKMRIIREDGIWETDVDFAAGTYRSTAGEGCYWAKLADPSGEFESIIANGSGANQTVTIDSPWFETTGCGTWEPVG